MSQILSKSTRALTVFATAAALTVLAAIIAPQTAQAASDVDNAYYEDSNGDGVADQVVWNMSNTINGCTFDRSDWRIDEPGGINITDIKDLSCSGTMFSPFTSNLIIDIEVSPAFLGGDHPTGGDTPKISYLNNSGNISLGLAPVYSISDQLEVELDDAVAPKISWGGTKDVNGNGTVDELYLTFSELINTVAVDVYGAFDISGDCQIKDYNWTGEVLVITTTNCPVEETGITPTVSYDDSSPVNDIAGNTMTSQSVTLQDEAAPITTTLIPPDGETAVGTDTNVEIEFSEEMNIGESTPRITLEQGGTPVNVNKSWDAQNRRITLDPVDGLSFGTTYAVELDGVVSAAPNQKDPALSKTTTFETVNLVVVPIPGGNTSGNTGSNNTGSNNTGGSNTGSNNTGGLMGRSQANSQLPSGIAVDDLVKLPNDGDPTTYSDTSVYYVGLDGKRHPFWNDDIFLTWYDDFSEVEVIDGQTMADIPLGKPILVRPGTHWVKIQSVPKTYYVAPNGYTLRWVKDEQTAELLGGNDWNENIIDVPSTLFTMFNIGQDLDANTLQNGDWPAGSLLEDGNGDKWYISENGEKRKIESSQAMNANRFQNRFVEAPSNSAWTNLPNGNPIQNFEDKLFSEEVPLL